MFVDLDLPSLEGSSLLTLTGEAFTEPEVDVVDRADRDAGKSGAVRSGQV